MNNKKKKNTNFKYFFSNKFYDQFTLEKEEILQLLNNDLKYYIRKKKKIEYYADCALYIQNLLEEVQNEWEEYFWEDFEADRILEKVNLQNWIEILDSIAYAEEEKTYQDLVNLIEGYYIEIERVEKTHT